MQLKKIKKHYGETYVELFFDMLADEHSNNWVIAKKFQLSLIQVQFLRLHFNSLYKTQKQMEEVCKLESPRSSLRVFSSAALK